jgi:hypothetical protein
MLYVGLTAPPAADDSSSCLRENKEFGRSSWLKLKPTEDVKSEEYCYSRVGLYQMAQGGQHGKEGAQPSGIRHIIRAAARSPGPRRFVLEPEGIFIDQAALITSKRPHTAQFTLGCQAGYGPGLPGRGVSARSHAMIMAVTEWHTVEWHC